MVNTKKEFQNTIQRTAIGIQRCGTDESVPYEHERVTAVEYGKVNKEKQEKARLYRDL